jgi:hypothetical protein
MSAFEDNAFSFVVKIWRERREVQGGKPLWRGRVDYVQGGERVYFHRLDLLITFLKEVIGEMGIGEEDAG